MASSSTFVVAIIGVGLVGAEFVDQFLSLSLPSLRLISLSSSKFTLFAPDGLDPFADWRKAFSDSKTTSNVEELTEKIRSVVVHTRSKAIIVDNTSSDLVANFYPIFLKNGFHVITPNKKAFSSSLTLYKDILESRKIGNSQFLNESTVGAGLPVISTLKDLVTTGDEVIKIEGVFSGTLSYIFNEYSTSQPGGPKFSSVVAVAKEKGYTEPHPGDDLNGADVARKLTILSRFIPPLASCLPDGYKSVSITSLVPTALADISSGEEFMKMLPEFDNEFEKLRQSAQNEKSVLRYVGVVDVEKKVIKAALEKYPDTHPFATSLGGSDNIIMFHTKRYGARPLIIQGAGAGAAVTAMGVLSDLLKLL